MPDGVKQALEQADVMPDIWQDQTTRKMIILAG